MSEVLDLNAVDAVKSYAKYYYRKPNAPTPELSKHLGTGEMMSPEQALPIEMLNDLLNPGYFEVETGYCILPNGAGYVSVLNQMPGVTIDMVNWWFAWHALDDLRYKIWWPEGHFGISVSDEDRAKILDDKRSMTERFQGLKHHVIEDVGGGKENIIINFLTPEDAGFDMTRFDKQNVGTVIIGNGLSKRIDAPEKAPMLPAVMCHFVREIPGGVEFRSRFWMGYQIIDKKPVCMLPEGVKLPAVAPMGLFYHNILEYSNLKSILPEIYEEQKGVIA